MVITFSAARTGNGPRPINPNSDFPQLVKLLKLVFAGEMENESRRMFDQAAATAQPALMWRLDPVLARLTPGFVWVEDGRIVGNVTLLTTRSPRRFLVANVAVHPDFRRRGIARMLMEAVGEDVRRRGGQEILLQVEYDNDPARVLYETMGYGTLGIMTTWKLSDSRIKDFARHEALADLPELPPVRELPGRRWEEAYALDALALRADLNWPEQLERDAYKRSLTQRLLNFAGGRKVESWATMDDRDRLCGLASIHSEWGRAHQLSVRVHPDWQGTLERPLLQKVLRRTETLPRRRVILVHNAADEVMNQLAREAQFVRQRTLTHMRLVLANG